MDSAQDQKLIFTPPAGVDGERTGRLVPREHRPRLVDASLIVIKIAKCMPGSWKFGPYRSDQNRGLCYTSTSLRDDASRRLLAASPTDKLGAVRTWLLNGKPASKAARQRRLATLAALMAMLERGQTGVPTPPPRGGQLSGLQITT